MFPGALLHVVSIWICVLQGVSTNKQICTAPQLLQSRDTRFLIFPTHMDCSSYWLTCTSPAVLQNQTNIASQSRYRYRSSLSPGTRQLSNEPDEPINHKLLLTWIRFLIFSSVTASSFKLREWFSHWKGSKSYNLIKEALPLSYLLTLSK